jgi:phospholipase D1/2
MMKQYANNNTKLYREIFNCYPDDKVKKFEDLVIEKVEINKYLNLHKNFKGNIVEFPLNFLKDEQLNRTYFCREIFVPIKNFL